MPKKKRRMVSVVARRLGPGVWSTTIPSYGGLHARTLLELREQAQELLAGRGADLRFIVDLPLRAQTKVKQALEARKRAEAAQAESQRLLGETMGELLAAGLSTRDAEAVLGLSYQRLHQLFESLRRSRIESYREALSAEPPGPQRERYEQALRSWESPTEQLRRNMTALLDLAQPPARSACEAQEIGR